MLKALLRIFASLPLPVIHGLGVMFGYLYFLLFRRRLRRTRRNLRWIRNSLSHRDYRRLMHASIRETGKGILETFAIWFRPEASVLKLVRECKGWEHVETAHAKGKGIIFLTPHLGCYEITAIYYASHYPISVLFKPPRNPKLGKLVEEGRKRSHITLAPTNMSGIRTLLKTLKKGEAVGILPDQVPEENEGEWANFFGRQAYTMTLVGKLAESTGATVLLAFGERLPLGRGYVIHIEPLDPEGKLAAAPTAQDVNDGIERLVRQCPQQYLWSYGRFKRP
ncbi:MAG: lipid A biosynthesis acyltransferase [Betaproteobacteria bacterium HGW-Betaproteobacteria-8]|nr:MAG: lipid A biosynthesis acyltransferase [Betaproteobacteria bacterium HGW-Betaproteobacteria-8]